jgi:hypothetical protein
MGTLWAMGRTEDLEPEDYMSWAGAVEYYPPTIIGSALSLYLIEENVYFDLITHSWLVGSWLGD